MTAAPSVFSYEWEPVSTKVAGVDIEVNLFNIAPCAVVVDASGLKVHLWKLTYLLSPESSRMTQFHMVP